MGRYEVKRDVEIDECSCRRRYNPAASCVFAWRSGQPIPLVRPAQGGFLVNVQRALAARRRTLEHALGTLRNVYGPYLHNAMTAAALGLSGRSAELVGWAPTKQHTPFRR